MKDRVFGVELEVGNEVNVTDIAKIIRNHSPIQVKDTKDWEKSYDNAYWHVKFDSSCGRNDTTGWEIASFCARQADLSHIACIGVALANGGCQVNPRCGFHVHVEIADLELAQLGLILGNWLRIESILTHAIPEHRFDTRYSRNLRGHLRSRTDIDYSLDYDPEHLWDIAKPNNFARHGNEQRKVTLNFMPIADAFRIEHNDGKDPYKKTVELRMPEGTLDYLDIYCWTKFFVNFVDYSANMKRHHKVLSPFKTLKQFFKHSGIDKLDEDIVKNWFLKRFNKFSTDKKLKT